ncbi:TPA: phage tail protein [Yersinia enterocolitica]|uniref:phage tail protein n=11 Tax=Yersinia enterocolitica TaxID=630 RepID=UPI00022DD308|nr:phage tail protein [Yersinia enterocolitica]EHB20284.1 Tail fiber protein [Yersinia enterocolitica subsp. palearctica PhRBD_Ye1]EKN3533562.1 phage tail protein [Yersinia enterocolitica]EKN3640698.1 phage tail protein [Yersinia enterocolitica]EKN3665714.1 phage tail protein [Yersinia enterocolitica]EKN3669431.1 phage tail protein [Yersinia enterocolitica]
MTARFFALLTNIGAAKLANATALGTRLEITHMAVGDGGGTLPTPNPAQTQLVNEQRRAALNTLSVDPINTSQIIAEQVIPEAEGGWWIREIGLLDKDGDLIAIANCAETYKPLMQEGSGRTQTIRVILIVSSTAAVSLKIDPSVVLATRKYVDDKVIEVKQYADKLLSEHEKSRNHPDASKTEKGFVKLSSATTSDSEVLAATPKAVKTVADNAAKALDEHGKAENPHSQYLQMGQLTGVVGTARNARMSVTAPSATATFTAEELIVQAGLGWLQYKLAGFNKSVNLGITGAGGMDTGSAPANGFVALYVIYNPTTQGSALLAVNATSTVAPEVCMGVMPAGYTASALVSVWGITSSLFRIGFQSNRHIAIPTTNIYSVSGGTTTQTVLGVSPVAPPNAKQIDIVLTANETVAGNGVALNIASSTSGIGQFGAVSTVTGQTATAITTGTLALIESQRLYFSMSNTNPGTYIIAGRGYSL